MKQLLTFFFLLSVAYGQLGDPVAGEPYSTEKKENFSGFIGENATSVFTVDYLYISRKKQELTVRKFHKSDLKLVESRNIYMVPEGEYYSEPSEVFYQDGKFYLFTTVFADRGNQNFLGLEIFNEQFERVSSGIVDTLDIDEQTVIKQATNKQSFLICRYNSYSKLTEQKVALTSVSVEGIVKWQKEVKSPMALQNLIVEELVYSGTEQPIYILCNYAFDLKNNNALSDQDMLTNKYSLWAYHPKSNFLKEFELRIRGKWINGIKLNLNAKNDLMVSGYMNESRNRSVSGAFSLSIDQDLNLVSSKIYKFTNKERRKFLEEKELEKVKELEDYGLNEMFMQDNGSYFLVGERYYKYIERNYDPRTNITTTTEHFNYNSIIVSFFDSLGNHIWTERVPKYQNSTNDFGYYASFSALNTRNGIYLFFNDSDKNNEVALGDYFNYKGLFNNRRAQISYVQIGEEGVIARGPLISADSNYLLRAKQCFPISDETMYLLGESGRQSRIFSVSVKEEE